MYDQRRNPRMYYLGLILLIDKWIFRINSLKQNYVSSDYY